MAKLSKFIDLILLLGVTYLMAFLFSFNPKGFRPLISLFNNTQVNNLVGWTIIIFSVFIIVSDGVKRKIVLELFDLLIIIGAIMLIVKTNNLQFSFNILNYWYVNITGFLLTVPFSRFLIRLLKPGSGSSGRARKK
ncbi:MAG: hypothetical protein GWP09_00090 [Nitrospiraceae bacterium]|nr:hypothetical protein [Nitrospiraceae bacterium]